MPKRRISVSLEINKPTKFMFWIRLLFKIFGVFKYLNHDAAILSCQTFNTILPKVLDVIQLKNYLYAVVV